MVFNDTLFAFKLWKPYNIRLYKPCKFLSKFDNLKAPGF